MVVLRNGTSHQSDNVFQYKEYYQVTLSYYMLSTVISFYSVVGIRLREGYYVDDVTVMDKQITVLLKQPWQPGVTMEYSVTTVSYYKSCDLFIPDLPIWVEANKQNQYN